MRAFSNPKSSQSRRRGAALVEFSVVLPLLLALLFGSPGLPNSLEAGSPVSVKISAAYKDVSWLPAPRFLSNKSLSATSTMPREK